MGRAALVLLALSVLLVAPGCSRGSTAAGPVPVIDFETGQAQIISPADTFVVRVEIAETPQQHEIGLMWRPELPEGTGMIFLFGEEQPRGTTFWMYRTYVPLSVGLLDDEYVIREIRDMEPCHSRFSLRCPKYLAGVPFHAALEVNRGYFELRGVGLGDRVILSRDP